MFFFFSSRRRHTRWPRDWSSDVCSSDLPGAVPPAAAGPRTVDDEAGISYKAYGLPWQPWPLLWHAGTLGIPYGVGQHFITESYAGGDYHASILSAAVPVAVND